MESERCSYVERCVLPGIPNRDRAKIVDFAPENKGVKKGVFENPPPSIRKNGPLKKFKKRKDLRAYVKSRLKAPGALRRA
jgi:hypothetical protein